MVKPTTLDGYQGRSTLDFERVLVTLLRGLGPWKNSVYLVGGLTPRYLVRAQPPAVPVHAGTLDVDIVVDLQILADIDAYHTLEQNLRKMNFERAENDQGQKLSWRWKTRVDSGAVVILELLADNPDRVGGRVQVLPTEKAISALNIPNSSIVFDMYDEIEVTVELLGNNGIVTETVKHANLVSFTCLKAFAFEDRGERKDAHDLIYCIEHAPEGLDGVATAFRREIAGRHGQVVQAALGILRKRFAHEVQTEGYLKDGPTALSKARQLVDLVNGITLERMLKSVADAPAGSVAQTTNAPTGRKSCPICGAPMEQKLAQQGQFKGQPFWSCMTYPKCRGIVHIERVA